MAINGTTGVGTAASKASTEKVKTVDELLERSRKAVEENRGPMSAVQKLLAGREDRVEVNMSPVQRVAAQKAEAQKKLAEPYTEQDWFLEMRMNYIRGQLDFYSKLGGEIGNSMMDSLEAEIKGILKVQQGKLKKIADEADAKQKEADAAKDRFAGLLKPADLLKRSSDAVKGVKPQQELSAAVQALLKNSASAVDARGGSVNKKA